MSDTFTASNGRQIEFDPEFDETRVVESGRNMLENFDFLNARDMDAMREFFQHERDKKLGRWRWPENPDYVVYPKERSTSGKRMVRVVSEAHGYGSDYCEGDRGGNEQRLAASAYFAAHPEPKPWHDAKPGEVWVLRVRDESEERPYKVGDTGFNGEDIRGEYWGAIPLDSHVFTAGRRIWPEVPSE